MDDDLEFFVEEVEELEKRCFNEWDYEETKHLPGTTENGIFSLKRIKLFVDGAAKEGPDAKAEELANLKSEFELQISTVEPSLDMVRDMDTAGELTARFEKCIAHLNDMIAQIDSM